MAAPIPFDAPVTRATLPASFLDMTLLLCRRLLMTNSSRSVCCPPVAEPPHHGIEDRRQKDAEQRHPDHAGEDCRPKSAAHFGPGSLGDHQWKHAKDERE